MQRNSLIDKYLPVFEAREYHEGKVKAASVEAYAALRSLDLRRSALVRLIFAIRELPARLGSPRQAVPQTRFDSFLDEALKLGWRILEEIPNQEMVLGAVTQPWMADVHFRGLSPQEFVHFAEPGFAKIAWSISARPSTPNESLISTETRVTTTDPISRRRFRLYWLVFSPGIRLIRRLAIRLVRKNLASQEPRALSKRA